ncbi:MAG TPA: Ig-like domain-containing protein [Gemmatimonadaceae bacterium]|nr:Ig-like domain-containing protein [Gemmatimonadaceae bacterium]
MSGLGRAGTVTVTATAQTQAAPSASASVTFTSPPKGIVLVRGGGQSGKVGSSLPQPAVVRVVAEDGSGVAGTTVLFSAPTGGSVGSASVVTDGSGNASTTLKLGTAVGTQAFAATALSFSVAITENATAGDPAAMGVASGDAQTDTVGHALKHPLVAKVTDTFGNPVGGVTVSWARTGAGTLAAATSATDKDGLASVGYTLGNTVGSDAITASVNGVTTVAKFTATAVAGSAAKIEIVSGDKQVAAAGKSLPAPFVVKVSDAAGNLVAGAAVAWTASAGTITPSTTTDSKGIAQNTLTLGKTVGDVTVTASVGPGKSVTFTATAVPGPVAAIAFGTQPTSVAAGAKLPSVTVTLTDAFGNVSNADGAVTIALGNNPSGATLGGTLTRTTSSGTATFDDLEVDKAGSGYTLVATSNGLSATSAAFNVTVGTPAHLQVIGSPSVTLVAGTSGGLQKFLVTDAGANPVAGAAIHLVLTRGTPDTTLADTSVTTDASGVFDLNQYIPRVKDAGVYTLTATVAGAQGSPARITATVTPGAATKVVFATSPTSGTAGAALSPQPRVAFVDAFGNLVTSATDPVTLAIQPGSGTPGAVLSGTKTANAVHGIATFTDLSIDKPGAGYCLEATSGTLTPSCTPPFPVNTGAATQLIIQQQPTGGTAGGSIGAINVAIADANGNIIQDANNQVTLALTTNPGSGALTGTRMRSAVNGVATFGGLSIDKVAIGYQITASSAGLASAVTNAFNVSAGAAAKLAFLTPPPTSVQAGVSMAPPVVVQIQDALGNPAGNATGAVTIGIQSGPSGAQISGNGPETVHNANATFASLQLNTAGGYTLIASSGTLQGTTAPVTVTAGAPSTLQASGAPFTITAGTSFSSGTVTLTDGQHNPIQGVQITFTMKQGGSEVNGLTPRVLTTDALGSVSLADLTTSDVGTKAGVYDLEASAGPGVSPLDLALTINPAAASKLIVMQQPAPTVASGGTLSPQPALRIEDEYGNATTIGTPVTASLAPGFWGTLGGTTSITPAANGVIAFTNLSITASAGGLQLAFSGLGTPVISNLITVTTGAAAKFSQTPPGHTFIVPAGTVPVTAPVLKTTDLAGNPVGNVPVHFVLDTGVAGHTAVVGFADASTDASGSLTWEGSLPTTAALYHVTITSTAIHDTSIVDTVAVTAGSASKLGFLVPSGTVNYTGQAGSTTYSPALAVAIEDRYGNIVTQSGTSISLAISTNPGGGSLVSSAAAITTSGVAVFTGIAFDKAAIGYTLTASGGGFTASSLPLNISAGNATKLVFTQQPTNATANVTMASVNVQVRDQFDNVVPSPSQTIFLALTDPKGATLSNGSVNSSNGNALFTNLSINLPNTYSFTATSSNSLPAATSNSFVVSAGAPASIALAAASPTSASVVAGGTIATPPSVVVKDGTGTPVSGVTVTLTVKNFTGATLATRTVNTDATGTASFSALLASDLPTAAGSYTIEASTGTLAPVVVGLSVTAAAPSHLSIGSVSPSVVANATLAAIPVTVLDTYGNVVKNASGSVAMTLSGGATLNGTASRPVSSGVATFTDLSIPTAGTNYQLTATFPGGFSIASRTFNVTAGTVTQLQFVSGHTVPSSIADDTPLSSSIQVLALDASNNPVSGVVIDAAIDNPTFVGSRVRPPGPLSDAAYFDLPTFVGTASVTTNASGVADFGTSKIQGLVQRFSVQFTAHGTSVPPLSSDVQLTHGTPHTMSHEVALPSYVTPGHVLSMQPKVRLVDINGNPVDDEQLDISFAPGAGGDLVGGLATTTLTTDGNGEATIPSWTVGNEGAHTIWVDLHSDNSIRADATVNAAVPHHLVMSASTLSDLKNGDAIPEIDATVMETAGHALEDTTFTVSVVGHTHVDSLISIAGNAGTDASGKARFANLVVDAKTQAGATLDFSLDHASGVSGQVTFNVTAGTASALDFYGDSVFTGLSNTTLLLGNGPTVRVKDHNRRNGVRQQDVPITWKLDTGCSALSFSATGQLSTTSTSTDPNGRSAAPNITVGLFGGSCTLTASNPTYGSVSFTLKGIPQ